jgi:ribose transport system substrate-binding protein
MKVNINTTKISLGFLCPIILAIAQSSAFAEDQPAFTLSKDIQARVTKGDKPVIRVSYHDVSNEFAPFIQRALAQGIPVVTFNTDNPTSHRLAFAGQDLVESGRIAGKLLADTLGGKGNVIITTLDAAAQWSLDREKGAREALGKYPGIKILTTVTTGTEPQQIYSSVENAMQANKDVDGILSLECCSTPAAGDYIERNNLTGKVKIVGFDMLPETIKLVQGNVVSATIDQAPERQSYEAVRLLLDVLKGKQVKDVDTGAAVYTQKNIGDYIVTSKGG